MKKLLLISLLAAILALCGCAKPVSESQSTIPLPPSIQTSKTPLELLAEAADNVKTAGACTIQYGTVTQSGGNTAENLHTQQLSPEQSLDWNALYAAVPDFPTNQNLLSDFCAGSLQAIPSNTGTVRYERTGLTQSELDALMYGQATEAEENPDTRGTIAIEVDRHNRLSRLEFTLERYGEDNTLQYTVTMVLNLLFP